MMLSEEQQDALLRSQNVLDAFAAVRFLWHCTRAAGRICAIERALEVGADAMPQHGGGARGGGISKPTENRALFELTNAADWLQRLREDQTALVYDVGLGLVLCDALRACLGKRYGNAIEAKYIDGRTWRETAECIGCSESHARRLGAGALRWIDAGAHVRMNDGGNCGANWNTIGGNYGNPKRS